MVPFGRTRTASRVTCPPDLRTAAPPRTRGSHPCCVRGTRTVPSVPATASRRSGPPVPEYRGPRVPSAGPGGRGTGEPVHRPTVPVQPTESRTRGPIRPRAGSRPRLPHRVRLRGNGEPTVRSGRSVRSRPVPPINCPLWSDAGQIPAASSRASQARKLISSDRASESATTGAAQAGYGGRTVFGGDHADLSDVDGPLAAVPAASARSARRPTGESLCGRAGRSVVYTTRVVTVNELASRREVRRGTVEGLAVSRTCLVGSHAAE
jgi:hypothetical protein